MPMPSFDLAKLKDCWLRASDVRQPENEMQGTEDDKSGDEAF